ncbi:hypothetical protein VTK56DRAFT_6535 [Thermocarpiscus australiensis]
MAAVLLLAGSTVRGPGWMGSSLKSSSCSSRYLAANVARFFVHVSYRISCCPIICSDAVHSEKKNRRSVISRGCALISQSPVNGFLFARTNRFPQSVESFITTMRASALVSSRVCLLGLKSLAVFGVDGSAGMFPAMRSSGSNTPTATTRSPDLQPTTASSALLQSRPASDWSLSIAFSVSPPCWISIPTSSDMLIRMT